MKLVVDLVESARASVASLTADSMRTRLLANMLAAAGEQREGHALRAALPPARHEPDIAHRLAANMHARTQDDFYPPGRSHLGAVVLPAVLAVAGPRDALPGMAAGYAVMGAVSRAYARAAQERGWRPTGVFGPMGAAAAAAFALELSPQEAASAIGLASAMSGGTNQAWLSGSDEWLIVVANASRAGVEAAMMAGAGLRAADDAIEGRAGWAAALFRDAGADALRSSIAADGPTAAEVAIKRFPISGIAHAPAWAALQLAPCDSASDIEVRMSPSELAYPGGHNRGPFRSRADALMSIPRCVTLALRTGAISYEDLLAEPDDVDRALMLSVQLVPDEGLEETQAVVTVTLLDGSQRRAEADGTKMLYPEWDSFSSDLDGLSRDFGVSVEVVTELRDAVASGAKAGELLEMLLPSPREG